MLRFLLADGCLLLSAPAAPAAATRPGLSANSAAGVVSSGRGCTGGLSSCRLTGFASAADAGSLRRLVAGSTTPTTLVVRGW